MSSGSFPFSSQLVRFQQERKRHEPLDAKHATFLLPSLISLSSRVIPPGIAAWDLQSSESLDLAGDEIEVLKWPSMTER